MHWERFSELFSGRWNLQLEVIHEQTSKQQQKAECKEVVALRALRALTRSPAQGSTEQEIFSLPQLMLAWIIIFLDVPQDFTRTQAPICV